MSKNIITLDKLLNLDMSSKFPRVSKVDFMGCKEFMMR